VSAAGELLPRLVVWASQDANIRRLVLVGSRARDAAPDELADIDLQVYARTPDGYTGDEGWLSGIGRPWLCVRDEYVDEGHRVPTRLVLFDQGVKVDFAFYPADAVSAGIRAGLAHRILLDKDGAAGGARTEPFAPVHDRRPSEAEFSRAVEEFWFETYHVAKYLARDELWLAKSRDWATKQFLLRMIGWHEQVALGRPHDADSAGKRRSMNTDTWETLHDVFARFGREESWRAMFSSMDLFRRLATRVAETLGYGYPFDVDANISRFLAGLRDASSGSGG
jgi:aminoglycoside 6-adenylyltransferase